MFRSNRLRAALFGVPGILSASTFLIKPLTGGESRYSRSPETTDYAPLLESAPARQTATPNAIAGTTW